MGSASSPAESRTAEAEETEGRETLSRSSPSPVPLCPLEEFILGDWNRFDLAPGCKDAEAQRDE